KIGTIQRRLAWPLHKDDTLFRSGRPTGLNIYAFFLQGFPNRLGHWFFSVVRWSTFFFLLFFFFPRSVPSSTPNNLLSLICLRKNELADEIILVGNVCRKR
ncbi:hypothetical protein B0H19DRAFT_945254, partial [Mycena capillaripes]